MQNSCEGQKLAQAIRNACFEAAFNGYENARIDGLCHEGAWEVALDSIRSLDVDAIVERLMQLESRNK